MLEGEHTFTLHIATGFRPDFDSRNSDEEFRLQACAAEAVEQLKLWLATIDEKAELRHFAIQKWAWGSVECIVRGNGALTALLHDRTKQNWPTYLRRYEQHPDPLPYVRPVDFYSWDV